MKDNAGRPRFIIHTLGCKVNQVESEAVAARLEAAGWHHETTGRPVDVCIINTCTVTSKAAMQARQAVRRSIREHADALIVVTGCHAQTNPADIEHISGVHRVIGNSDKSRIPEIITADLENAVAGSPVPRQTVRRDIGRHADFFPLSSGIPHSRSRPFVKIQDGCNAFCTYCIVPHARGRSRSMPVDSVIEQIRQIRQAGYWEAVLTGIHLGTYGEDLSPKTSLLNLLKHILDHTSLARIRLSSIESRELSSEIIALAAGSHRICRHFHVPLQSGDDDILSRMNRPYQRNDYRETILAVHRQIPDCGMGADVLVGFPGETDSAFQNTVDLIAELPITYLHVFPFSPRRGTSAFDMPDRILPQIVKQRAGLLRDFGNKKKEAFYKSLVGRTLEVLPETKACGGRLKGISSNYVPVVINGPVKSDAGLLKVNIRRVLWGDARKNGPVCEGDIVS